MDICVLYSLKFRKLLNSYPRSWDLKSFIRVRA